MTETRVYIIHAGDISDTAPINWPDKKFAKTCESNGQIFSLKGFEEAINNGVFDDLSGSYVRFIKIKTS